MGNGNSSAELPTSLVGNDIYHCNLTKPQMDKLKTLMKTNLSDREYRKSHGYCDLPDDPKLANMMLTTEANQYATVIGWREGTIDNIIDFTPAHEKTKKMCSVVKSATEYIDREKELSKLIPKSTTGGCESNQSAVLILLVILLVLYLVDCVQVEVKYFCTVILASALIYILVLNGRTIDK